MNNIPTILDIRNIASEIERVSRCPDTKRRAREIVEKTFELVPGVTTSEAGSGSQQTICLLAFNRNVLTDMRPIRP